MVPWCRYIVLSRCHGAMVSGYCGVTVSWYHGVRISWGHGVMMPRCQGYRGVKVSWYHGVRLSRGHGVIVLWCLDIVVSRCHGNTGISLTTVEQGLLFTEQIKYFILTNSYLL